MKTQLNEMQRMQQLAGLLTEAEANRKYYAIINTSNKYTSKSPLYFSTDSKEDMISTLNKLYKEMTGKNDTPYTLDDINPYSKMNDFAGMSNMGNSSYINDGWVSVDDNEADHKANLKDYPNAKPLEV
jgi:hypothetical protein